MVILSENSCHCNAMQCNFNEGDKLGADRPLPITVDPDKKFKSRPSGYLSSKCTATNTIIYCSLEIYQPRLTTALYCDWLKLSIRNNQCNNAYESQKNKWSGLHLTVTEEGRSMTTFHYCSVNHQSGLQGNKFSKYIFSICTPKYVANYVISFEVYDGFLGHCNLNMLVDLPSSVLMVKTLITLPLY